MKTSVIRDIRDYSKEYWRIILMSLMVMFVCYGFLVFSGNIRIDTEELINHPGSKLGWLTIGRFGLALLKDMLGLGMHYVVKSGILFFLFFAASAIILAGAIYHFSGYKKYSYWIFLLLYMTSNIWSFQIYFSVQQAEVAFAMMLLVVAAILAVQAMYEARWFGLVWRLCLMMILLVLGLGAYQALAAYYVAVCIILFLAYIDNEQRCKDGRLGIGSIGLVVAFGMAYVIYRVIANTWFMATAGYMEGQMGWGKYALIDCVKNVLRTVKNVLLGVGPRNFSFYTIGVLLALVLIVLWLKKSSKENRNTGFWLRILALLGLMVTPFLMTIYMGEMLVTRSQFALPIVAAFLGMYAVDGVQGSFTKVWFVKVCYIVVVLVVVGQVLYNFRMTATDEMRYAHDVELTEELVEQLCEVNDGEFPEQPIVFVGYREPELGGWCRRTEMYGWSFYGWDYSRENPTGATHRIAGFIQAYSGYKVNEDISEADRQRALEMTEKLNDFPAEDAIKLSDDLVVVRLSDVSEEENLDWW